MVKKAKRLPKRGNSKLKGFLKDIRKLFNKLAKKVQ
jgi:hypothetical protein